MNIRYTRKCNLFNLKAVSGYLDIPEEFLVAYYEELLGDRSFLKSINQKIVETRKKWGFTKGIFAKRIIPSIDWFAFERVLIYALIRHFRPNRILETGVYYGGNSAFALLALMRNGQGSMISIDYPDSQIRSDGAESFRHPLVGDSEHYDPSLHPGFMVPDALNEYWTLIEGDSLKVIPSLQGQFDFYIHDSDHSMKFLSSELALVWPILSDDALALIDDIDWSNAFFSFCVKQRLYPLLLTDNGKDDLRVRTGIVLRSHHRNGDDLFT